MSCANCGDLQTVNVTRAGRILGFSRWTVQDMIRAGELRFIPRGRKGKRIPISELRRWQAAKLVSNGPAYKAAVDGRRKANRA